MPVIPASIAPAVTAAPSQGRQASGFSLVELLVALTLSLMILAALGTVFANSSQARVETERTSEQIENGRYAMQMLTDDLRNAGYLGEFDPRPLPTPTSKPNACATDLASLRSAMPIAVQGYDDGTNAPPCLSDVKPGTDVLVVRRASTCALGEADCDAFAAGMPHFQTSSCSSAAELGSGNASNFYVLDTDSVAFALHLKDCNPPFTAGTVAPVRRYRTHIYFIANNDVAGDSIPTLKRAELGAANSFSIVPLVEGIENLQIEYGVDTATATVGEPAQFTSNPDGLNACPPATCSQYWRNIVGAKIHLLARNTTKSGTGNDNKTYYLGLKADGTTANTAGPFTDGYKRHVYDAYVRLNNVAGRNTP